MPRLRARRELDDLQRNPDRRPTPDHYKMLLIAAGNNEDDADKVASRYAAALMEAEVSRKGAAGVLGG